MRLGLIGSLTTGDARTAQGASTPPPSADFMQGQLQRVCDFLLRKGATRVVYLGREQELQGLVNRWELELAKRGRSIWQRTLSCIDATAEELEAITKWERRFRLLERLQSLPEREPLQLSLTEEDGTLVSNLLVCQDRGGLTEEQVESASVVAFARSDEPVVRRIGHRLLVSPGSLEQAGVMLLATSVEAMDVSVFDMESRLVARHGVNFS